MNRVGPRSRRLRLSVLGAALALLLAACGSDSDGTSSGSDSETTTTAAPVESTAGGEAGGETDDTTDAEDDAADSAYPIVIEHALGTTVIESPPERIATVQWANHEVPLALGVVPVGMAAANFGDDDDDGLLPWVKERLDELGAETPVLFDEGDGIDFEGVADTNPDVILASYSGLTQEDYDTLSEIAPVVAYPEAAWSTSWRDIIRYNSLGMGMGEQGDALIESIEAEIAEIASNYPELEGRSVMFVTHVDSTDLSQIGYYTANDTRVMFFEDLGMRIPDSVAAASAETDRFALTQSAEQIDFFDDVDIITGYGDENGELLAAFTADPLIAKLPAVARGSIALLPGSSPLGTAANPTPLAISWVLDDYLALLSTAAANLD